jgi:hypothetical protein
MNINTSQTLQNVACNSTPEPQISATVPAKSSYCHRLSLTLWKGYLSSNIYPGKLPIWHKVIESVQTQHRLRVVLHYLHSAGPGTTDHFVNTEAIKIAAILARLLLLLVHRGHTLGVDNFYNSPWLS